MGSHSHVQSIPPEKVWSLVRLSEAAMQAETVSDFASRSLSLVADLMQVPSVFLYVNDDRLGTPLFVQHGMEASAAKSAETLCRTKFARLLEILGPKPAAIIHDTFTDDVAGLALYPIKNRKACFALLGTPRNGFAESPMDSLGESLLGILTKALNHIAESRKQQTQLRQLSTYMLVSSMLIQPLGLNELLQTVLYCCIEVTSAEEASVLLLDDEKKNLCFYQLEGLSKPLLMDAKFPADKGIAGSILQSQQSEIIHDVPNDPRYYGKIDRESGFKTRNMIVVPLTAGEEKIGLLTVLNKQEGGTFTEDEQKLLLSIADEIAFAVRNAKVFDYVVNTYCKQRQGWPSCRGCKRPLGSWTPCVKYREERSWKDWGTTHVNSARRGA